MRALLCSALFLPSLAMADVIPATSRVTAVTIYPQGAEVTREVSFTAPAGPHEIVITDLPATAMPELMKVTADKGQLGAFALRDDRLPPQAEAASPEMQAAEAEVEAARAGLRRAEAGVAAIRAEIEAQEAEIAFLGAVKMTDGAATAAAIAEVSQTIGARVLAARQAALAAGERLPLAQDAVAEAEAALGEAEARLEAVSQRAEEYQALSVSLTGEGGAGRLLVTHYIAEAGWRPDYDMALDRKAGQVTVTRGVVVSQYAGEDWAGVALTLSTARPSEQSAPSILWPELRRVEDPVKVEEFARSDDMAGAAPMLVEAAPAMSAETGYQGDTVIYAYPAPVDLASGVEDLRLTLDRLTLAAKVRAEAVPRLDETAYLVAEVTNTSGEILLPGEAFLYRDGALTGMATLEALAPGDEARLGFGAIDGLRLRRDMPERAEGDRGILTTSTQIAESAVLEVENLTAEAWPVRVLDQVPYSEQEELEISFEADPAPSEENVEDQRGILAWEFDLPAGETREIRLDTLMSWPEGKVLQ